MFPHPHLTGEAAERTKQVAMSGTWLPPWILSGCFFCSLLGSLAREERKKERKKGALANADRPPSTHKTHRRDETRCVVQVLYQFHETIKKILKDRTQTEWIYPRGQSQPSWHWPLGKPSCPPPPFPLESLSSVSSSAFSFRIS